ncbi:alpha/beta fold hydrolase [Hydrogenophaga sp. UC242_53]|uniref:alpha/beta fold hydrolase n=1 Tax=Hydrogenophaga sp. UC242_53 TaxID=3350170 RepID=UPI0036D38EE1
MPSHPLVLLHGLNTTAAVFDGVRSALPSTLAVHTPELPALADVDAIASALFKTLPARFHLVGFSFGGYVALADAGAGPRAPERPGPGLQWAPGRHGGTGRRAPPGH